MAAKLHREVRATSDEAVIARIDRWLQSTQGIEALCKELAVSPRHLQRITRRTHGGPPRQIASKWRVLRAAANMHLLSIHDSRAWEGFADQSHFIRDFRRFAGLTPGHYQHHESVARRVLADEWHLNSDHPLALASRPKRS